MPGKRHIQTSTVKNKVKYYYPVISGIVIIAAFYLIFKSYFPNKYGKLGHDYSYYLPNLLDGTFWYHVNGILEIPWFTPSFGGGLPKFPNPQSLYYSIPQFLCFFVNPILCLRITLLLFGAIGYYGCYVVLKKIFLLSSTTSNVGATIFLFNGFFIHRLIIGHLSFHGFMLFPLFIYFILHNIAIKDNRIKTIFYNCTLAAVIFAYLIYSGAFYIIPSLIISTALAILFFDIATNSTCSKQAFSRLFISVLGGCLLGAAYLNATFSFLHYFPRNLYPLPGISNVFQLLSICFNSLFFDSPFEFANHIMMNKKWYLDKHEFEFGVGVIPLLILCSGIYYTAIKRKILLTLLSRNKLVTLLTILLLLIPISINFYTPGWNHFLKSLPLMKNSSSNFRWLCTYIPFIILLSSVLLDKIMNTIKLKKIAGFGLIVFVVISNLFKNRDFYTKQFYDPEPLLNAYNRFETGNLKPEIESVNGVITDDQGRKITGNNLFVSGSSQIYPYEPIFGYRLENYPLKYLTTGSVWNINPFGVYNFKNPAYYIFPEENHGFPGDHFKQEEKNKLEQFINYRTFDFSLSTNQKIANTISMAGIVVLLFSIFYWIFIKLKDIIFLQKKNQSLNRNQ